MTTICPPTGPRLAPMGRVIASAGSGGRFLIADGASAPASAAPLLPPNAVQAGLLGLQMEPESRDDHARRRGRLLLAGLAAMQRQLLETGRPDPACLGELRGQLDTLPRPVHRGLAEALDAIALRVEVELARYAAAG